MSLEIRLVRGPLDDQDLSSLSALYGPVDAKYRSLDYVRHQFVGNPFGWSVHVFAVADREVVGHCGVVPFRARLGTERVTVGKLEALAVVPAHRGTRAEDGGSVATDILTALYPWAVENGMAVLFGLAPPAVARIHVRAGCRQVPLEAPAYVIVSNARAYGATERSRARRLAAFPLCALQNTLVESAYLAARLAGGAWRSPREGSPAAYAALAAADEREGEWTVSGSDAWSWFAGSGVLRSLELPGRRGSRAIVRVDESQSASVQLVAWEPLRDGLLSAVLLLGAAARLARRRSAPTLRVQPWYGSGGNGSLRRACRLLGLVERPEVDLLVYSEDPRFARASVSLTPFFYVTF